ncbi:MAG TPA: zinc carboxypeptidase [Verrucomicrobiales bacterium]|nr:zinc carboxypeptidase [Verrucomicrobiales bacterium]
MPARKKKERPPPLCHFSPPAMHLPSRLLAALSLAALVSSRAAEPEPRALEYYLPVAASNYDPAVPTPQQALGFQVGEWHLHHHELVDYLGKVAAQSDRVTLTEYARSHGRRPLVYLAITAPENHARLEDIRKAHLARVESPEKDADISGAPIVVWMGYGVHGNEPSASNASVLLAYHLAAARDAQTADFLKKAVVLLEPCLNPDGFERFADWTNSHRGRHPSARRADREHQEGWPSGRSNYYWFDLNRDWLPAVHPESQGRLRLFHDWQPNIVTDYHEMGNVNRSYFFQPGIAKMVHPLTPKQNQALTEKMAQEHAKALDAIGSLYYTGESYDDYYIGKGSTYPDVNGSVGVLFEQASSRGYHQDTEHGRLDFPFTIRNQITTSLSTLRSAHALRAEFLAYQQGFYRDALKEAAASKTQAFIFSAPGDSARLEAFQTLLARHQIQSHRPAQDVKAGDRTFAAADSLVVPARQRQFRLITAMFETRTKFESNIFYDVSAWHLPSAFGLLHAGLESAPAPAAAPLVKAAGALTGVEKAYAYVFSWEPRHAPRALWRLIEAKARCWAATRAFSTPDADGKKTLWPHGSIVVPVAVQDRLSSEELRQLMETIAKEDTLEVRALGTGYHGGVPDLGSPTFQPLENNGVLLVTGAGAGSVTAGEIWHHFDQVWQTPLTMAEGGQLTTTLLNSFSTVILASTPFTSLPVGARSALQSWVSRGGCLIAIGSSAGSLAAQDWCKIELAKAAVDTPPKDKPTQETLPYEDAAERRTGRELNGVIVEARYDRTHPLAWGFGPRPLIQLMRDGATFLKPASSSYLNPLQYTDAPLVSGSASKENLEAMKAVTPVQVKVVDSGRVILLTDNPVFRGHWLGTEKLLANAIFFGPHVSTTGGDEDEH